MGGGNPSRRYHKLIALLSHLLFFRLRHILKKVFAALCLVSFRRFFNNLHILAENGLTYDGRPTACGKMVATYFIESHVLRISLK